MRLLVVGLLLLTACSAAATTNPNEVAPLAEAPTSAPVPNPTAAPPVPSSTPPSPILLPLTRSPAPTQIDPVRIRSRGAKSISPHDSGRRPISALTALIIRRFSPGALLLTAYPPSTIRSSKALELPPVERVVALTLGDIDVAFPFSVLAELGAVNEEYADQPVAVFWKAGTNTTFGNTVRRWDQAVLFRGNWRGKS